jgi:hypothetical protein
MSSAYHDRWIDYLGRRVRPLITPDDPERLSAYIRAHSNAEVHTPAGDRAPFL